MLKNNETITDEVVKAMAQRLFSQLPQCYGVEPPKFANGWLAGYRTWNQVEKYFRRDESNAPDRVVAVKGLEELWERSKDYKSEDIYNMDETARSWKMSPDGSLTGEG